MSSRTRVASLLVFTLSCAGAASTKGRTGGSTGDEGGSGGDGDTTGTTGGSGPATGGAGGTGAAGSSGGERDAATAADTTTAGGDDASDDTATTPGPDTGTGVGGVGGIGGIGGAPGTARQGAGPTLYTVPNNTFIEQPTGERVVTVNDTSGTVAGLQAAIDAARSANASSVIVIHLKTGATYAVSSASLVLGSHMALVGTGATLQAASAAVTVPLVSIAAGATKVSVAGGTYDGGGAKTRGIYGSGVSRVNVDKVVVKNCALDGILLIGAGNTMYDSEFAVTRSDCSGGSGHAGIAIQQCTMAYLGDNNAHDNLAGLSIDCAWANVANNVTSKNTTGIEVGGDDNVVVNNDCNDNATGLHVTGTNDMILSNAISGNTKAGIASAGMNNNYLYNKFGSAAANASDFTPGTGDHIIAWGGPISNGGANYFYPPLIDNQHTKPITTGKGRTDLNIASTSMANVQSQYNAARSANPSNTIVLHLNGTFPVTSAALSLSSDTCVLLNGTVQMNAATTANAAFSIGTGSQRISISGGTIDGGGVNGNFGVNVQGASLIQVDKMTIQNLGDNSSHHSGSDSIRFFDALTPNLVTRNTINKSGARGIWSQNKGKTLYADNVVAGTRAGIDCDSSTFGAVMMFNKVSANTYGLWYEQGAQHNVGIGNVAENNVRNQLDSGNLDHTLATNYNSYICNRAVGGLGIINSGVMSPGGTTTTLTSHNFMFNNVVVNASIKSSPAGSENYYSQNAQMGGSLTATGTVETFFNPAVP